MLSEIINKNDGHRFPVSGKLITIGSDTNCNIQINQRNVPDIIAHIIFQAGAYKLRIISDQLLLKINGKRINEVVSLNDGDVIKIGKEEFLFTSSGNSEKTKNSSGDVADIIAIVVKLLRRKQDDITPELVNSVSVLLKCDAARLVSVDSETNKYETICSFPDNVEKGRFSQRAIVWAEEASEAVLLQQSEWEEKEAAYSLEKNAVRSLLCAPLVKEDRNLGFIYLDRLKDTAPFNESDRSFLNTLLPLFTEIINIFQERKSQREIIEKLQESTLNSNQDGFVFASEEMKKCIDLASRYSKTDAPVIITGETGTGKELMAKYIHNNSLRKEKPYRAVNCGAIPENLIESELFGYEKGAFTGAEKRKIGLFEAVNGGTVFLDEIGDLPFQLQVKLLRVLQESEITRVGGNETIPIDVRMITATHKNLSDEIQNQKFRQDLYYRLNVLNLHLPPLKERGGDLLLLAEFFIMRYSAQYGFERKSLSADARNKILSYNWPGNIRELQNVIQKACILGKDRQIQKEDISFSSESDGSIILNHQEQQSLKEVRKEAEAKAIKSVLEKTKGNISASSKILDIDRKWLSKIIMELGIDIDQYRDLPNS